MNRWALILFILPYPGQITVISPTLPAITQTSGDTIAPTITWVTPNNAVFYGNDVSVRVLAKDNLRVVRAELFRAGNPNPIVVNSETQLPSAVMYLRWQAAAIPVGTYVLTAFAYDAAGNRSLPAMVTVIRK